MAEYLGGGNPEVAHAIRQLSQLLVDVAADLRRAHAKGHTTFLLDYLRSEEPMLPADRHLLADMLQGIESRPPGRRENIDVKRRRRAAEAEYQSIRQIGTPPEQAWRALAAFKVHEFGDGVLQHYGFKRRSDNILEDLATQFAEWYRRPQTRK